MTSPYTPEVLAMVDFVAAARRDAYNTAPRTSNDALEAAMFVSETQAYAQWVVDHPAPVLDAISPDTAVAGDPADIVLSCTGTGFNESTVITFGNFDEPTTFVSDTEVTTVVKPSIFVNPDTVPVKLHNSVAFSDPVDFTFTAPVADPAKVAADKARIAADQQRIAADDAQLAADEEQLEDDEEGGGAEDDSPDKPKNKAKKKGRW
jgi:hypothetical protein